MGPRHKPPRRRAAGSGWHDRASSRRRRCRYGAGRPWQRSKPHHGRPVPAAARPLFRRAPRAAAPGGIASLKPWVGRPKANAPDREGLRSGALALLFRSRLAPLELGFGPGLVLRGLTLRLGPRLTARGWRLASRLTARGRCLASRFGARGRRVSAPGLLRGRSALRLRWGTCGPVQTTGLVPVIGLVRPVVMLGLVAMLGLVGPVPMIGLVRPTSAPA